MHSKTIILQGESTISSFRLNQLNNQLKRFGYEILDVKNTYLVNIDNELELELNQLEKLLKAKVASKEIIDNCVYIAPRLGTISPWSSKATDILHNCGFDAVHRIEHSNCLLFKSAVDIRNLDKSHLYDRMMESIYISTDVLKDLFIEDLPQPASNLSIIESLDNLNLIDKKLGLALSDLEKEYLLNNYKEINKEPTETELMMFAQANSEHCRHKISKVINRILL